MVWMAMLTSSSFNVILTGPIGDIDEQSTLFNVSPIFAFIEYFWSRISKLWSLRGDLANDYFCFLASRGLLIYNHLSPKCVLVKTLTPIVYGEQFSFNVSIVFFSWSWNYLIVCVVFNIWEIYLATKLVIPRRSWMSSP